MDPGANPFNPGAGAPPPELVGRDSTLRQATIVLERIKRGRAERSLLLGGLRGVGKTVLLREIRRSALENGYLVEMIEAQEERTLAQLLVPALRRLLPRFGCIETDRDRSEAGFTCAAKFSRHSQVIGRRAGDFAGHRPRAGSSRLRRPRVRPPGPADRCRRGGPSGRSLSSSMSFSTSPGASSLR
ncbi:MAG: AAA family ATPase [Gammaproteobacteria bacterium]